MVDGIINLSRNQIDQAKTISGFEEIDFILSDNDDVINTEELNNINTLIQEHMEVREDTASEIMNALGIEEGADEDTVQDLDVDGDGDIDKLDHYALIEDEYDESNKLESLKLAIGSTFNGGSDLAELAAFYGAMYDINLVASA